MAMTINTNVVSINSQRNLSMSGASLGTTMQRLSSGLRVNSAKDDAAGLAIAERMNAQSRGLAVAARNANDGISLAQTAEGALGKVGDMLQRMRELAVQSSNATNSADDRKALQAEVSQLTAEIDRVAKTSSFNGKNLLDGSFAGGVFQVGASAGDNITVGGITNAKASALSNVTYGTANTGTIAEADMQFTIGAAGSEIDVNGWEVELAKGDLEIKVDGMTDSIKLDAIGAASSYTERLGQVVAAVNAKTADTGVTAFLNEKDGAYSIQLMSKNEADGVAKDVTLVGFAKEVTGLGDALATSTGVALTAMTSVNGATDSVASSIAGTTVDTYKVIDSAEVTENVTQKGIDTLDITTQAGAWLAMESIDSAIDEVNSARADLGALQTRFEKSIENIDIMNENISAARGRIVDADFAAETANLSRSQILQQAGTAMVAQANQLPQQVLSLLQ